MCIGCRQKDDKVALTRLVWDARAALVRVDAQQRLPGRGCYLHPSCRSAALKRRAVGHSLRVAVDQRQVEELLGGLPIEAASCHRPD